MTNSFIKWAGGKGQLLSQIERYLPNQIYNEKFNYIEPFVGGGSMLFFIIKTFKNNIDKIIINDINPKLINVYNVVRNNVNDLISELSEIKSNYLSSDNKKELYLNIRDKFNNDSSLTNVKMAAYFIFLNKTCFNGLYRTNKKGMFNVPFGNYSSPSIFDNDNLLTVSELLQSVIILNKNYKNISFPFFSQETNFFYFDPPYKPISKTSNFNSYFSNSFDDNEQIKLKEYIDVINCYNNNLIMISNSYHSFFNELYKNYNIHVLYAKRSINSDKNNRGKIKEILVTNY